MKKTILTLLTAAISIFAANLNALTLPEANYRDIDLLKIWLNADSPVTGSFFDVVGNDGDGRDLLGFDGDALSIVDVVVGFVFAEFQQDGNRPLVTRAKFNLGDIYSEGNELLDNGSGNYEVTLNSSLLDSATAALLFDVQEDGRLDWSISLSQYDVEAGAEIMLYSGYMGILAVPMSSNNQVPDTGTTAAMLGVGVFGMALFGNRRRKS